METRLRPFRVSDLSDFLSYQRHPDVLRLMPVEALSEERATNFLRSQAKSLGQISNGYSVLAIELVECGKIIGEVGLDVDKVASVGRLGWTVHPAYQRRGYATRAVQKLIEIAFQDLSLHRLTAICEASNAASLSLMRSLNMRREAYFVRSIFFKGAWRDEILYALLRDEWNSV